MVQVRRLRARVGCRGSSRSVGVTRSTARGFTLIELLTVAAILSILATMALSNLHQARIIANEKAAIGGLNQLQNAMEQYRVTSSHHYYPQYLTTGLKDGDQFRFRTGQELFQNLVNNGLLPQRYSGWAYDTTGLIAPGYKLQILPFDRPGVDIVKADVSQNYAIAMQPDAQSAQPNTFAIINGDADGRVYTARMYKLPDRSLDLSRASIFVPGGR